MTLYSLVLFLHVGAALALASALSIDALILFQLRRATSPAGAHLWLDLWPVVPWTASGSGLFLLFSGGYLADRMSAWTLAWPKMAFATLILIGLLARLPASGCVRYDKLMPPTSRLRNFQPLLCVVTCGSDIYGHDPGPGMEEG
jgi:hypothetical protein